MWLDVLGIAFFLLNLFLFVMNCVLITMRFHLRPGTFLNSFTDQLESLFIPAVVSDAVLSPGTWPVSDGFDRWFRKRRLEPPNVLP
jgi:hypothetical protein